MLEHAEGSIDAENVNVETLSQADSKNGDRVAGAALAECSMEIQGQAGFIKAAELSDDSEDAGGFVREDDSNIESGGGFLLEEGDGGGFLPETAVPESSSATAPLRILLKALHLSNW